MRLNKETLKRIIKEELQATLRESMPSGGTDYYNKLVTLMRTKAGVYQAESLYEFARGQLAPDEQTFLDNCFKLLELGREATKIGDEIGEIGKQIREIMARNDVISVNAIYGTDGDVVKELIDRKKELYHEIRELDDLFDQQSELVGDSVGRMDKENPRVYAFYNSREAGVEEASGHFGMLSI